MPIYEYRCDNGHNFDVMQRMSDDPVTECEVCGSPVRRVLHSPAVHFKGSGFYNTDYGTKKRGPTGGESSKESGSGGDSGSKESSSDSKSSDSKSTDSASGSSSSSESKAPAPAKSGD